MAPIDLLTINIPFLAQVLFGALFIASIYYALTSISRPYPGIPVITLDDKPPSWTQDFTAFAMHANELTAKGLKATNGPFQVYTSSGYKIILPNRFTNEMRNNLDLSFALAGQVDFHTSLPGMEGFREGFRKNGVLVDVVRVKLTQSLSLVTEDLVEEASLVIRSWLSQADSWTDVETKDFVLDVVARVSSRIFGGKKLARDDKWVELAKRYTVDVFAAVYKLRSLPAIVRPIASRFLPECREIQAQVREARRLAEPEVEKRLQLRDEAIKAGAAPKSLPDVFSWMLDVQKGREMFFAETQLTLSMAAIHTTTEMVMRCMIAICDQPELQQALREEIVPVLQAEGWAKSSLFKMKLLDSFIKECMRLHQMSSLQMMRVAEKPVVLSDGTALPKGSYIHVIDSGTQDPFIYENPEKFNAWRYLRKREQPGEENHHQFVATSPDNLGFGHGLHACPGRFFASNEIKIILCFLLVEFEWRYGPGQGRLPFFQFEANIMANPGTKVQAKKRKAEIDILRPMN